jgi:NAD(P)-dependent dehydrogenase (short-subunit alcohol dehydrogenase family)
MNNPLDFSGTVALVTGSGSGMGLVTANAFAEAGAALALADVTESAVRSAAEKLVAAGHKASAVRCNVADEDEVAAMVQQTVAAFGRLDAAFNNAGVMSPAVEIADVSREEYDCITDINLRGVWNCMKHELRHMREQGSGAIVTARRLAGSLAFPDARPIMRRSTGSSDSPRAQRSNMPREEFELMRSAQEPSRRQWLRT